MLPGPSLVEHIRIADIFVVGERRPVDPAKVTLIARSIGDIGLRTPITIRIVDRIVDPVEGEIHGAYALVAGHHRLQAARHLGWERIDCIVMGGDAVDAELWEIAENLHRADLTALERDEQVARWIELTEKKAVQFSQTAKIESKRDDGKGHRAEGGVSAAARDLGVDKDDAYRAVKVVALSPEAKAAARERGLDDNRSALLEAARVPAAEQAKAILEIADRKALAIVGKAIRKEQQDGKKRAREAKERGLAARQRLLPDKRYGVIYADPEWRFEPYSRESGMDRAADNHYPTSETSDIVLRPVGDIADKDCVLFLWATAPMLPAALRVMAGWGFAYKSQLIWNKDRTGTGYWFRNKHELLLVGTRGDVPAPAMGDQWPSVVDAPVDVHSAKPEVFAKMIEEYFPNLPKIELNARRARPGWDVWGLEAPEGSDA